MKLRILSDLHLEGFEFNYEWYGEDVVILAGDIHTMNRHHKLLERICSKAPTTNWEGDQVCIPILMVAGNHEYYDTELHTVNKYLNGLMEEFPSFTFLNNTAKTVGNVAFFGGTMFTDFGLYGETARWFAEHDAKKFIADFSCIKKFDLESHNYFNWTINDHKEQYDIFNDAFDQWVRTIKLVNPSIATKVCISHFMPSERSIAEQYKASNLSPYFTANNENRVQLVDYWIHGHTHNSFDYMLGNTRVVCNPKGYGKENQKGFKEYCIIEI